MATTQLFVELLIIGFGAGIWLAFLLAAIFHIPWGSPLPNLNSVHFTALAAVAYVVGIIVDRLAWSVFHFIENYHRKRIFGTEPFPSVDHRENFVLVNSADLRDKVTYNRSRLRICRSWIVHFVLTGVCAGIWASVNQQHTCIVITILGIGLTFGFLCACTAYLLARDYYINIRKSYDFLTRRRARNVIN